MTDASLVVIGTAAAGPEDTVYVPETLEEIESLYAPSCLETLTYTATATGATLSQPAWGSTIDSLVYQGGKLVPARLYNLSVSGATVTFGAMGSSGTVLLRYQPIPGESDIAFTVREIVRQGGVLPAVYRLSGIRASCNLSEILLRATESGSGANSLTVTVPATGIALQYTAAQTGEAFTWSALTLSDLVDRINQDGYRNRIPFLAELTNLAATGLSPGNYAFSGGVAATVTTSGVAAAVSALDEDFTDSVLLAGGSDADLQTGLVAALAPDNSFLFFLGSPVSLMTEPVSSYRTTLVAQATALNHPRVFLIPGWTTGVGPRPDQTASVSLAAAFAALWTWQDRLPTHQPSRCFDTTPAWTADDLHSLSPRCCPFTRFIQTGIAPWSAGPTNGQEGLLAPIFQSVRRALRTIFEPWLGRSIDSIADLSSQANAVVAALPGIRDSQVTLRQNVDTLEVMVDIVRYGEVRTISFAFEVTR